MIRALPFVVCCIAVASSQRANLEQRLHHQATRMSMACVYAIEAYGPEADALPRIMNQAFDEVDRIDRLMSHYKADSELSRVNREAARGPVAVWGFFRGEGRVPTGGELTGARQLDTEAFFLRSDGTRTRYPTPSSEKP